jgi:hypothetical protein
MSDNDFTLWEGEQFEYELQTWLDRNQELIRRIAERMSEGIEKILGVIKDFCAAMWVHFREAVASAADAIRRLWEVYTEPLPQFGAGGPPPTRRRGRRRPPPVRDLRSTAVRGPHTFRRY